MISAGNASSGAELLVVGRTRLFSDEIRAEYQVPPSAFSLLPALARPKSRGYLRLKSAEPDGPIEIQPNFLKEGADVNALVTGCEPGL